MGKIERPLLYCPRCRTELEQKGSNHGGDRMHLACHCGYIWYPQGGREKSFDNYETTRPLSEEDKEWILKLKETRSCDQICKETGFGLPSVKRVIKKKQEEDIIRLMLEYKNVSTVIAKLGVTSADVKRAWNPERERRVKEMKKAGRSYISIAKKFNINIQAVRYILRKNNNASDQ